MNYLNAYFQGVKHPSRKTRYDIVESCGDYELFERLLVNMRNPNEGGLSFYVVDRPEHFGNRSERKTDKAISKGSFNVSSIMVPDPGIYWGYGDVNGTDDAILVHFSKDWLEVEIFISSGQKANKLNLYQLVTDGELDDEIASMREDAEIRQ